MKKQKCEFCGNSDQDENKKCCVTCGANLPALEKIDKWGPSFYRGYLVFFLKYWEIDSLEVQFWLGERMVDRIRVTHDVLREFVKEDEDYMPFFYSLLQVSQGEIETLRVETMNSKEPALFEVRRIESSKDEWKNNLRTLNTHQLYDALKSY